MSGDIFGLNLPLLLCNQQLGLNTAHVYSCFDWYYVLLISIICYVILFYFQFSWMGFVAQTVQRQTLDTLVLSSFSKILINTVII